LKQEVTGLEPNPNIIETILDSYAKLQETEAELRNDANEGTSRTPTQQGTKVPQGSGQSRGTTDTNLSQTKKGKGTKQSGQPKQSGQQSKQSSVGKQSNQQGAPAFREDESVEDYAKRVGYENIHMAVNSVTKNLGKSVTKETITKQDVADASQVSESLNQGDTSYSEKGQELSRELQNAGTTKEAKDWFFEQYKKSTGELTPTDISALFEEYKKRFKELKQQEEERIRQQQNEVEEQARQGPDDVDPNIMQSRQKNRKGRRLINEAVRRLKKSFPNIQVNILTEEEFLNKFREFGGEEPTSSNPDSSEIRIETFCASRSNAGADQTICEQDSIVLNATGGNSYEWQPATGLSCDDCQSPTASPANNTEYTLIASNQDGCKDKDAVLVEVED
jgi:hypothetical protein